MPGELLPCILKLYENRNISLLVTVQNRHDYEINVNLNTNTVKLP